MPHATSALREPFTKQSIGPLDIADDPVLVDVSIDGSPARTIVVRPDNAPPSLHELYINRYRDDGDVTAAAEAPFLTIRAGNTDFVVSQSNFVNDSDRRKMFRIYIKSSIDATTFEVIALL